MITEWFHYLLQSLFQLTGFQITREAIVREVSMIYTDSRYADGIVVRSFDSRKLTFEITLFRQFSESTSKFYYYTWTQRDRIDLVANELLGDPTLWWVIMDYNPEIGNPLDIQIGTVLRIPGA